MSNIKKVFWIVLATLLFIGSVLYLGNVFIIGDHLKSFFGEIGVLIWYGCAVLAPAGLLIFGIAKNLYSYDELNISAMLEDRNEAKIDAVLKRIADQPESTDSMLDRYEMRKECNYITRSGNRTDKINFMKRYYEFCDAEAQKTARMYAVFSAVSVVLSPKSIGDMLALLVWQCRIISSTLKIYTGRPDAVTVCRLYAKVLLHSFMAGSVDEVFDQFAFGPVNIKLLSLPTQAMAAIAACSRTASLTRYYIQHGLNGDRKEALRESLKKIPEDIIEVMQSDEFQTSWKKFLHYGKAVAKETGKHTVSLMFPGARSPEDINGPAAESTVTQQ